MANERIRRFLSLRTQLLGKAVPSTGRRRLELADERLGAHEERVQVVGGVLEVGAVLLDAAQARGGQHIDPVHPRRRPGSDIP